MTRLPTGSLVITTGKDGQPHWEGKWRHQGRQIKRRLGPAWLRRNGDGWEKRPGRPQEPFLSREDAIVALRSRITAHAAQEAQGMPPDAPPTFAAAAEAWYERAERRQRKPTTLRSYRQLIDAYMLGQQSWQSKKITTICPFATKQVSEISKHDMRGWFDAIPHSRTKERLFKAVKSIVLFSISEGWISENIAASVDCPIVPYDDDFDFFERDEIERLIAAAEDDYDAALYATAAYAGLRRGELMALQWRDIDFERQRITVRRNLAGGQLGTPKSGKIRVVPLMPDLSARLKLLKRRHLATQTAHVFANPARVRSTSHPWPNTQAAMKRYQRTLKRARLRPLTFHSLRHSFGSHAVRVATLVQVKNWMGHSSLQVTGRYLHAKSLDTDADLLAQAF